MTAKDEALKMAIEALQNNQAYDWKGNPLTALDEANEKVINACKEALEQPEDYLYVYKGSEMWLKDSLDIPSAGFLIGKIRLEK